MSGMVPGPGLVHLLGRVLLPTLTVRLYQNDITPNANNVLGDFVAATFPGYTDQVIQPGMSAPIVNPGGQAFSQSAVLSWVRGAGVGTQTIYGYVVFTTDGSGNTIFGAERFATPRTLSLPGESLTLQIGVLLSSGL